MRAPWYQWSVVLVAVALSGCEDRARTETRLLSARVESIDAEAEAARLRAQIGALEKLALETDDVRKVRERCLGAYRALLDATEQQEKAAQVTAAVKEVSSEKDLSDEDAKRILEAMDRSDQALAALKRSNDSLVEAQKLLPRCHDDVAALEQRFAGR